MKKLCLILCVFSCLFGCNSPIKQDVDQHIKTAQVSGDYRLYASSGRRLIFPGIDSEKFDVVIKKCGKKYMAHTGDVITSQKQKLIRKQNIEYMILFNKRMIVDCFNKIDKPLKLAR